MPEAIIEPDLPIIDPHHHLWDRRPVMHLIPPPVHGFDHISYRKGHYLLDQLLEDTGSGHNIVPGQFITFSTVTTANNVTTAAAVTSTTATTVVVPLTASNSGPNTEAGTITVRDATNFAVDLGHNWKAETGRMLVKFGEEPRTTGRNLIVSPLYGTVHRVGRTICFGSPFSALS